MKRQGSERNGYEHKQDRGGSSSLGRDRVDGCRRFSGCSVERPRKSLIPAARGSKRNADEAGEFSGEPDRIRTCDPLIKSQLLYQLSYGPNTGRFFMNPTGGGQVQKRRALEESSGGAYIAGHERHRRKSRFALCKNARRWQ